LVLIGVIVINVVSSRIDFLLFTVEMCCLPVTYNVLVLLIRKLPSINNWCTIVW